ncbi:MAG: hypothetical protein IMY67_10340 [Bacteroidetes bacterium]|nr:hypothetical protein [Bacteroidota bacterium]
MRQSIFALLSLCFLLHSCNDGDVITVELDFDQILELCGDENSVNYVIYDTKADPYESLTLLFSGSSTNDLIFNPPTSPHEGSFTINGSSTLFNYRTYDGDPSELICAEIPSSTVNIIEDYKASSGTVNYISTFIDDDNDGVPTANENPDPNGDGNFDDAQDTDGDSIPDYIDEDDDGDNVPTKRENPDLNDDGNIDDAQDTDGDSIPDYLDDDDDGDGVITRYEDENLNENLFDDLAPGATVARFLDATATDVFVNDVFITNTFIRTITVEFIIRNTDLGILNTDEIILGTFILEL